MVISTQVKVLISVVALILTFAVGRFTAPAVAKVTTATATHKVVNIDTKKDTHTITTTTTKKEASGAETITQVTDTTTTARTETTKDVKTDKSTATTYQARVKNNLSALGGIDFNSQKPVYGVSFNRELIGPITVGAWGLNNASGGISIGVNF